MDPAQWLLDLLICPACRGGLDVAAERKGLKCRACKRVYRIEDGIPVMLISEATIDEP